MAKKPAPSAGRAPRKQAAPTAKSTAALHADKPRARKKEAAAPGKAASAGAEARKSKSEAQAETKTKTKTEARSKSESKAKAKAKSKIRSSPAKARKPKAKTASSAPPEIPFDFSAHAYEPVDDPIGDLSDGEARCSSSDSETLAEMAAYRADTAEDALDGTLETVPPATSENAPLASNSEGTHEPRPTAAFTEAADALETASGQEPSALSAEDHPPAKLDRLQKILSQAGVASRRHAEEMILAGRIMVNGQVVTQLGAKADPARDHIRIDGKPIPAAERHRTFMLNKPRGFVTTVSDPEGRPTVMQFFSKMRERLYPVGRLDYESEGLLLVTNDGELANQLTRAASAVEKTYLVKVAGRPTAEELERLRSGVLIESGQPGSEQAQTAPARIRELHQGSKHRQQGSGPHARAENPWFEVILIEGRNRELRKMFQSIGHFVEKIRRVGYGPLVLDLEPGKLRELAPEELAALRRAAEGKLRPQKEPRRPAGREPRRFDAARREKAGRPFEPRSERGFGNRSSAPRSYDSSSRGPQRFEGGDRDRNQRGSNRRRQSYGAPREDRGRGHEQVHQHDAPRQDRYSGFNRPKFDRSGFDRSQFDRSGGSSTRPPNRFAARRAPDRPFRDREDARSKFGSRPNTGPRSGSGSNRFSGFDRGKPSFRPPGDRPAPRFGNSELNGPRDAANPRRPARPFSAPRRGDARPARNRPFAGPRDSQTEYRDKNAQPRGDNSGYGANNSGRSRSFGNKKGGMQRGRTGRPPFKRK
jgi:23S rRNA pseudouridine2605 synthase